MRKEYLKLGDTPPVTVGGRAGRLLIVSEAASVLSGTRKRKAWVCQCDCGSIKVVLDQDIRTGRTMSCGCLAVEVAKSKVVHGACVGRRQSKTYAAWRDMWQRCTNHRSKSFHNYGGRGIQVDEHWSDFSVFLADMGECPVGYTLDRRDPNGGYSKSNCHWATWDDQALNKRSCGTKPITFNGETLAPSAWAEKLGMPLPTLYGRLRAGLPLNLVLSTEDLRGKNRNGRLK